MLSRLLFLCSLILFSLNNRVAAALTNSVAKATPHSSLTLAERLLHRVHRNDRAGDAARTALPFVVGDTPIGLVLEQSVTALSRFPSVFSRTDDALTLVDKLEWASLPPEELISKRSEAVEEVLRTLQQEDAVPALRGWRDEPFAVRKSFASATELIVERAAAVLFGVPAYGVFVNGYTCEKQGSADPTHVWVGTRSATKATWPSRKDCLAAGGLAAGMQPRQAMLNECAEEAGIDSRTLSHNNLRAVSAVSYTGFNEDMWGLKRDVLFCFDLELPREFEPVPVDGEMERFEKIPIDQLLELLSEPVQEDDSDNEWKPNVGVVLTDFLVRHGAVDVDDPAFLELVDAVRSAKCS